LVDICDENGIHPTMRSNGSKKVLEEGQEALFGYTKNHEFNLVSR